MAKKIFALALVAVLLSPLSAYGAVFQGGETYYLQSGTTVDDNLYAGGGTVGINGAVNGDLMAGGGSVSILGPVSGDVALAGGQISVNSQIGGDVRIAGGNITVMKSVAGDLVIAGGQISVLPDSSIGKDAKIFGGTINYSASTAGNLEIRGGVVLVDGPVAGNLSVYAEDVKLGPNAKISGNFDYYSQKQAILEQGASVSGQTNFHKTTVPARQESKKAFAGFLTGWWLIKSLALIIAGLILIYVFGSVTKAVVEESAKNFWKEALLGFAILVAVPFAIIISFFSVVGIFLGFLLIPIYIAHILIAAVIAPMTFARLALKYVFRKENFEINWWVLAVSVLAFGLISMIPVIGWLFGFVIFLSAFGSVSSYIYRRARG